MVTFSGRSLAATVNPIPTGLFLKASLADTGSLDVGSVVEVDGRPYRVLYVLRFPAGENEVWATLGPVQPVNEQAPGNRIRGLSVPF